MKFLSEVTGCRKTQVSDHTGSTVLVFFLRKIFDIECLLRHGAFTLYHIHSFQKGPTHDFVSSICPPFSNNKLLSCERTIPFAAALTIAEFTTPPESRTDLIKN